MAMADGRHFDERENENEWIRFGMKLGVQTVLHPFEYGKVLIQIGFEPIAPRQTTTIFGRPARVLPNIFQYVSYIKSVDGLYGCYRGLAPKLVGGLISAHLSEKVADKLGIPRVDDEEEENITDDKYYKRFEAQLKRNVVIHATGAIISSPFHVISIRMMAQFIGRETKYTSILGSIVQIYKDEGIMGFFAGVIPRLLFDVTCVVIASTATYMVGRHFIREKEGRAYFGSFSTFICSSIFYPLTVASTCMAVNGCGLKAGSPPSMPIWSDWRHCYSSLKMSGDHKRGSSLFFRYIKPSQTIWERL